ncbi:hypothetical protein CR970_04255 [Candidatus Saccharibacteria bacterium]|nr:MAG: hypothetical protein CR970_04255 [Candidatus Saccharibacteria bacterium]
MHVLALAGFVWAALVTVIFRPLTADARLVAILDSAGRRQDQPRASDRSATMTPTMAHAESSNAQTAKSPFVGDLLWQQNFGAMADGPIDAAVWRANTDPAVPTWNNEAQAYTDRTQNVRIEGGRLVLEALRESYSYPSGGRAYGYTSARVDTSQSFSFAYGRVEADIRMPSGQGVWPAFWLLSANQAHTAAFNPSDADWQTDGFYLHDGELDVVEYYGQGGQVEFTAHTFAAKSEASTILPRVTDDFHTYAVDVTPTAIRWYVDGVQYHEFRKPSLDATTDDWPFQDGNRWYIILNLAMGGDGRTIDPELQRARMEIAAVRYYDLPD